MKKKILFVFILALGVLTTNAQKILFDNTKSEMANNADWVIDGGYSQFPSPAQSGITGNPLPNLSGNTDTYWSGALSMWGIELAKHNYTVETLPPSGNITYQNSGNDQDLSNYDVFVICEPNNPFSTSEKEAMINFVADGGGLFIITDHAGADRDGDGWDALEVWTDFFDDYDNPFGFTFDAESNITEAPTTNMANSPSDPLLHGIAGDVTAVECHGGASMRINTSANSSVKAIVFEESVSNTGTTGILCAYATYGSGKVVGINDSSIAEDETSNDGTTYPGWIQPGDGSNGNPYTYEDGILVTNATIWLATQNSEPYLSVSQNSLENLSYPVGLGPSASQNITISGGNLDGSNITITVPNYFEISNNNIDFSTTLSIAYSGTTLNSSTIYVRLKANLSEGEYNEILICEDNGSASEEVITLSGLVTTTPLLCDDFNNLNNWTVANVSSGSEIVISTEFSEANNTLLYDCPESDNVDGEYFNSYIEKTFNDVQNLQLNFWYFFEDYRGGEITIYINDVEQYSIYTDGNGDLTVNSNSDDIWTELELDLSSQTSTIDDYTLKIEGTSKAGLYNNVSYWKDRVLIDALCVYENPITDIIDNKNISIGIYPNPSSTGIFNITSNSSQQALILIYDVNGRIITSKTINNKSNKIDISSSETGLYFIKIETENSIDWRTIIIQ